MNGDNPREPARAGCPAAALRTRQAAAILRDPPARRQDTELPDGTVPVAEYA
ncbi:hypothetical protein KY389_10390 [Paracoccus bogoriensis]|nr:hypothetical protein [Paracoccus bogoriensis]